MSIPLDRLYHYIESVAQDILRDNVLIYRFYPHGSKNIEDLTPIKTYYTDIKVAALAPIVYCYDQEPLDFNKQGVISVEGHPGIMKLVREYAPAYSKRNMNISLGNIYDRSILLHTELNSADVLAYQKSGAIACYYWSHGIIARDWFRYAEYVNQNKNVKKLFLIYNRAWSGTREYRLKFADLLVDYNLYNVCQTSLNVIDPDLQLKYDTHQYINNQWHPTNKLENYFSLTDAASNSSADFNINDYQCTSIEVVLETLFDDSKIYLTEKILRPIACGQPFILASTPNSLKLLKQYGFKTFDQCWDENYDQVTDANLRLNAIVKTMKTIASWDSNTKKEKFILAQQIADYNKERFFSKAFEKQLTDELKTNLTNALSEHQNHNSANWWLSARKEISLNNQEVRNFLIYPTGNLTDRTIMSEIVKHARFKLKN